MFLDFLVQLRIVKALDLGAGTRREKLTLIRIQDLIGNDWPFARRFVNNCRVELQSSYEPPESGQRFTMDLAYPSVLYEKQIKVRGEEKVGPVISGRCGLYVSLS
jgi:hypothetical protein